jgi:putative ABC transport system substrate-binding protein
MAAMQRRQFIALVAGGAVAWPPFAPAQQAGPMPRIGYMVSGATDDPENRARYAGFRETLEKLGWAEGHNIRFDYRGNVAGPKGVQAVAAEIVGLAPNVILVQGSPNTQALQRVTRTVPIVFAPASDPVGSGLVKSMSHPGANVTGFVNFEFPMGAKWLEALKEVFPAITRVLVIFEPKNVGSQGFVRVIEAAAPALGVRQVSAAAPDAPEIEHAIDAFAKEPNGGLLVLPGAPVRNRDLIAGLAARRRLPAIYANRPFIASGGLMTLDTDHVDLSRRAASYVDRILRGEKPANLPVQTPTKFELVINLKVAKSLGLTVPPTLLVRADEVIE